MADANTVTLHRVLATKPEKVYRAFLNPEALAKWLPPYGFTCKVDHLDAKVGGTFRMSFMNFTTGNSHAFGGEYLELRPNERIRYTDRFDDPNLPGVMQVTVQITPVSVVSAMRRVLIQARRRRGSGTSKPRSQSVTSARSARPCRCNRSNTVWAWVRISGWVQ